MTFNGFATDDNPGDNIPVRIIVFVKGNDEEAVVLKAGAIDERADVALQPGVRLLRRTGVSVVIYVRDNESKIRQVAAGDVHSELSAVNHVGLLCRAARHIRE